MRETRSFMPDEERVASKYTKNLELTDECTIDYPNTDYCRSSNNERFSVENRHDIIEKVRSRENLPS